uniref:Uncharacterized protein n=1 Tax=Medicago truncatula TaxID=3880 RepID=A2Q5H5_MEDTR|nr:hypothetical protein MtrDRAFT_AC161399g36v2 [Medicago truncatula]
MWADYEKIRLNSSWMTQISPIVNYSSVVMVDAQMMTILDLRRGYADQVVVWALTQTGTNTKHVFNSTKDHRKQA